MTPRKKYVVERDTAAKEESAPVPAGQAHSWNPGHLRVCFITTEFHGLFKNGGIGTANTGLALAFSLAGFGVTVAFADADQNGPRVKEGNFPELKRQYAQSGIELDFVPAHPGVAKGFEDPRSASYCVYLYLKAHHFDVVYFNDCGGQGFFALLAKQSGVFPNAPRMYVVAHGPHEWVLDLNSLRYWDRTPIITAYLERRCAAMADALISPSQYLVDWMIAHNWTMPRDVHIIQNVIPLPDTVLRPLPREEPCPVTEIVFFGRLEVRKGIELFCDAVDLLNRKIDLSGVQITFMGKFSLIASLHSGMYVAERARRWRSSLRILTRYGQEEGLSYLARPQVLAVMPSSAENSPCVVAECLQLGVPFVATNAGGTVELISPEHRDSCLVSPDPDALAEKLQQILKVGQRPGTLAISQADTLAQWIRFTSHGTMASASNGSLSPVHRTGQGSEDKATVRPVISVCITNPSLWPSARGFLHSLLLQDYPGLEFLLVDDSRDADSQRSNVASNVAAIEESGFRVRIVSAATLDRGSRRNLAAAEASGDYLLFAEEDRVTLLPQCLATLVSAALHSRADVVTGVPVSVADASADTAGVNLTYLPIGACAELGGLENCFGAGTFLVAREAFGKIGGFQVACEPDIEDWIFLATSALSGLRLEVVPEPLFQFRMRPRAAADRSSAVDGYRRILDLYSTQKVEIFRHVIEAMVHIEHSRDDTPPEILKRVEGEALAIAKRVSALEPNSNEALRGFVQFCIERHRVQEALDFALHNGRSLLSDAIGTATVVAEALALDEIRDQRLDFLHEIPLTEEVRERIGGVPAFPARGIVQAPDCAGAHVLDIGITVLKAASVCPRRTRFVRAVALLELAGASSVFVALVVASPAARLRLSEDRLESSEKFWWSNWLPASNNTGEPLELEVSVPEPVEGLLDLHFLCKTLDDGTQPAGKLTWKSVAATIAVHRTITESEIEIVEESTPVPRHLIDEGVLLTPVTDFSFPIFVPGDQTLLHPLPGRTVLVRIGEAVPAGSVGVRSIVSLQLPDSHPVQFAVWARPSVAPVNQDTEFSATDPFSGWFSVSDKFRHHSFTLAFREPAKQVMDLYLATRVVGYPDVHFCHAVWHDLLILEGPESSADPDWHTAAAGIGSLARNETQPDARPIAHDL